MTAGKRPVVKAFCSCPACRKRTKEMYDLPGDCNNCGAEFVVRNRKGDRAPLSVDCPHCGVSVFSWKHLP
jgi:predicted RNA-binding Zn-ribbon protein involved in translation (DUF1610 family)